MRLILHTFDRPISWLYTWWIWGPRCSEYMRGCLCCEKWREHDHLMGKDPFVSVDLDDL